MNAKFRLRPVFPTVTRRECLYVGVLSIIISLYQTFLNLYWGNVYAVIQRKKVGGRVCGTTSYDYQAR